MKEANQGAKGETYTKSYKSPVVCKMEWVSTVVWVLCLMTTVYPTFWHLLKLLQCHSLSSVRVCCKDKVPAPCENSVWQQKLVPVAEVRGKVWVLLACVQLWERVEPQSQLLEEVEAVNLQQWGKNDMYLKKQIMGSLVWLRISAGSCSRSSGHSPWCWVLAAGAPRFFFLLSPGVL